MTAIYPGSFDPVTNGHMDIIRRAAKLYDRLIVAVLCNSAKTPAFSVEQRMNFLSRCTRELPNVSIMSFDGLLMDFALEQDATVIVRGLRAISDFESEFSMACMNHELQPKVETMFLMTDIQWVYLSSSMVKEICSYQGDISKLVPQEIIKDVITGIQKK